MNWPYESTNNDKIYEALNANHGYVTLKFSVYMVHMRFCEAFVLFSFGFMVSSL